MKFFIFDSLTLILSSKRSPSYRHLVNLLLSAIYDIGIQYEATLFTPINFYFKNWRNRRIILFFSPQPPFSWFIFLLDFLFLLLSFMSYPSLCVCVDLLVPCLYSPIAPLATMLHYPKFWENDHEYWVG